MSGILALAREHHVHVVEDAAQALFSRSQKGMMGTIGEMGCFSLGITKLVSMGFGGFVATRRQDLSDKLRLIREHGVTDRATESSTALGFNFRVSDLLSAVGIGQVQQADAKIDHVKKIYRRYCDGLENLPHVRVLPVDLDAGEVPLWTEVVCRDRPGLDAALRKQGIEIHPGSRSLSRSPQLRAAAVCQNSDFFDVTVARLPCGPGQPLTNVDRVIEAITALR
jgi:dTDP-4-amino-4,6-dideoxygalactose transaminase